MTNNFLYQAYNMGKKFTFYSDKTDVLQSESLSSLHQSQSLQDLMKDNTFWLDICKPSQADLNVIAEVHFKKYNSLQIF